MIVFKEHQPGLPPHTLCVQGGAPRPDTQALQGPAPQPGTSAGGGAGWLQVEPGWGRQAMPGAASHTKGVMGSSGCGGRAGGSGAGADPEREGAQPGLTEEQKAGIRHVAGHGPAES